MLMAAYLHTSDTYFLGCYSIGCGRRQFPDFESTDTEKLELSPHFSWLETENPTIERWWPLCLWQLSESRGNSLHTSDTYFLGCYSIGCGRRQFPDFESTDTEKLEHFSWLETENPTIERWWPLCLWQLSESRGNSSFSVINGLLRWSSLRSLH
jgi:hypothetical protein